MSDVVVLREVSEVVLVPGQPATPIVHQEGAEAVVIQMAYTPVPPVSGGEATPVTHEQSSPSTEWIVNHNFGFYPGSVSVLNSGGQIIDVDVRHIRSEERRVGKECP